MISAFGVVHETEVSKKAPVGLLKPVKGAIQAGKRRGSTTITGGAQTGGKHRLGYQPYRGQHAG